MTLPTFAEAVTLMTTFIATYDYLVVLGAIFGGGSMVVARLFRTGR